MVYRLAEGVRIASLDNAWAAFSALSGDTLMLNTEAAAILELLAEGPADAVQVAQAMADETGSGVAEVGIALLHVWQQLLAAGLVEASTANEHNVG